MKHGAFLLFGVLVSSLAEASFREGDEFAYSFWFAPTEIRESAVGWGFAMRKPSYTEAPMNFWLATKPGKAGTVALGGCMEGAFHLGERHHLAVRYSVKERTFAFWLDGRLQMRRTLTSEEASPVETSKLKANPDREKEISHFRTFETAVSERELLACRPSVAEIEATAKALETGATGTKSAALARHLRERASAVRDFADGCDVRSWCAARELVRDLDRLVAWTAPQGDARYAALPFVPVAIDAFHNGKHVPYRAPDDGAPFDGVALTAARGEIEATSFMFLPFADARQILFRPSDLTGEGGTLPSAALDVRIVKCWYGVFWGWDNFFASWRGWGALQPELLLHDDALVRVDEAKRVNELRLSYPEGEKYVDVSTGAPWDRTEKFNYNLEPVHDAATLQPFDLKAGAWRQLWLTLKVPPSAKPGTYRGMLAVSVGGKDVGSLPVAVEVLPFELPRAGTRYDPTRPMWGTWMHHGNLTVKTRGDRDVIPGGFSLAKAVRRLEAEFRNMAEHNMLNPWTMSYGNAADDDLTDLQLDLMRNAGLELDPVFGDVDVSWGLAFQMKKAYGEHLDEFGKSMAAYSNRVQRAAEKLRAKLGHARTYGYAMDEAWTEVVMREMPYFATINHFGGGAFTTSGKWGAAGFMIDVNDVPDGISSSEARHWHECGARCVSYAAPFSGPENADTWRRGKGIRLYQADFDGVNEYMWYEGYHIWNDFIADPNGGQYKNFCIVYPTADGVVDTIAWEALREGFDDIRYLTLLRLLARQALAGGKAESVALAKSALGWAEALEPETVVPAEMRRGAVARIRKLAEALGGPAACAAFAQKPPLKSVPIILPTAKSEAEADAYAKRGLCDLAFAYYAANGLSYKAFEMALKMRDLTAAKECLKAMKDDPQTVVASVRLRLTPPCYGWTPSADEAKAAAKAVKALDEKEARTVRVALLKVLVKAGCTAETVELGKTMKAHPHAYSNPDKIAFCDSAGDAAKALGDFKTAVDFYSYAAEVSGYKPEPLVKAAETALAGGDWKRAERFYSQALKKLSPQTRAADIDAIRKKLLDLHKRDTKPTLKPAAKDELTLDEED